MKCSEAIKKIEKFADNENWLIESCDCTCSHTIDETDVSEIIVIFKMQ